MPPRTSRATDSPTAAPATPAAPPRPPFDHPDARMLPPASVIFLEQWVAEYQRNAQRGNNIDGGRIRTCKDAIESHLHPVAVSPKAPDILPAIRFAVGQSFEDVETAFTRSGHAVHGSTRYTAEALALRDTGAQVLSRIRDRIGDRLKESIFADVRARMQKGADVNMRSPQSVLDGLAAQLACCNDPEDAALLSGAGLYPEVWAAELAPLVESLRAAVHKGKGRATTRGEVSEEVAFALLRLEIALSRAAAFLESFVSPKAAQDFEAEIPRKPGRKAKEGDEQTDGGEANGSEADPAEAEATPAQAAAPGTTEQPNPSAAAGAPAADAEGGETK